MWHHNRITSFNLCGWDFKRFSNIYIKFFILLTNMLKTTISGSDIEMSMCVCVCVAVSLLSFHVQAISASWASSSNTGCLWDTSRWGACSLQTTSRTTSTGTPSSKLSRWCNRGLKREETGNERRVVTGETWNWPSCSFSPVWKTRRQSNRKHKRNFSDLVGLFFWYKWMVCPKTII